MAKTLIDQIHGLVAETRPPHGDPAGSLTLAQTEQLAGQHNLTPRSVEIAALQNDVTPTRYLRNQNSFTAADQVRLLQSKVAVIGLGGLGGSVVEILARAGVGHMVLVDGDRFEEHNLNRQLFCTQNTIGFEKADTAKARIAQINGTIKVENHATFMTAENAPRLIENCDVVVDCLDNIPSRFDLEAAAKPAGIPMVSAALAGAAGHVTTIWPDDAGLELIYGARHTIQKTKGAETILGCLPHAIMLIAAMESAEVLKILLNQTTGLLRNKLWVMDLTDNTFEILSLAID